VKQVLIVLDHLTKHVEDAFLILLRCLPVKDVVPRKVEVLYPSMFAQHFKQWSDLTRRYLVPADIEIHD
jgi:hypothetical protein